MEQTTGARIQAYLKEHGIQQSKVAREIGVSDASLSAMLHGRTRISAEAYRAICEFLQVNLTEFSE